MVPFYNCLFVQWNGDARGRYLVMQRTHKQPIPYSLLMQGWSTAIAEEPLVIAITALDSQDPISSRTVEARHGQEEFALEVTAWGGFPTDEPQLQTLERLKVLGFSQVCLHRDLINSNDRTAMENLLWKRWVHRLSPVQRLGYGHSNQVDL